VSATAAEAARASRLAAIWETRPGVVGALASVDHKDVGKRYLVTAFVFLVVGGIEALLMRIQLAHGGASTLSPELYDELFTMHGVTMIFLYASPILSGFANYLWPILIGTRDMAFPRMNALSYWIFLFAGIFIYTSMAIGDMPDAGWFAYAPLTGKAFSPGPGLDFYALGLLFLGISTSVGAVNFIVTLFKMRAPGMSLNRMPILVWGTLTASFSIIYALPPLSVALVMLWFDRQFGMHFFDSSAGGSPLLWQHLFWIFGHPWVYIIVLPAMGMVSDIIPTFCRRPLVGYTYVAFATVSTGIIGFGVWVHHMFATGLPQLSLSFFSAASLVIAIPSGISFFAWIATIWYGRPVFKTPFLFMLGFIVLFAIGGVSGVMTGLLPFDWQLTDTYFVVAHLHYVLIGINVFPVVGALYYWLPKITGRMLSERLGRWNFWVMFIGFNVAFFPMHWLGILGMPRRIFTYPAGLGWDASNMVVTAGAFVFAVGILLLSINIAWSLRNGVPAGPNPWDAGTLEWSIPSPPPPYNFEVIPTVDSRHPLWENGPGIAEGESDLTEGPVLDEDGHEVIGTSVLDGAPETIQHMPGDSLWPLYLTLSLTLLFYSLVSAHWPLAVSGAGLALVCLVGWHWPGRDPGEEG